MTRKCVYKKFYTTLEDSMISETRLKTCPNMVFPSICCSNVPQSVVLHCDPHNFANAIPTASSSVQLGISLHSIIASWYAQKRSLICSLNQEAWLAIPRICRRNSSRDRKSTRLNSSHSQISYAVFCLKKKN